MNKDEKEAVLKAVAHLGDAINRLAVEVSAIGSGEDVDIGYVLADVEKAKDCLKAF